MAVLEESGQDFLVINYLQSPPDKDELREIIKKLDIKAQDLVRRSESIYKENYKDKVLSEEEWVSVMVENPILIERPILVSDDKAVIARPTEKINDILA